MEEESRARREVVSWEVMRVEERMDLKSVNHWREAWGGEEGEVGVWEGDAGRDG